VIAVKRHAKPRTSEHIEFELASAISVASMQIDRGEFESDMASQPAWSWRCYFPGMSKLSTFPRVRPQSSEFPAVDFQDSRLEPWVSPRESLLAIFPFPFRHAADRFDNGPETGSRTDNFGD
jgi:hypothetical protein